MKYKTQNILIFNRNKGIGRDMMDINEYLRKNTKMLMQLSK